MMTTLIIGLAAMMFVMGMIDNSMKNFKQTTEYDEIMNSYYADCRRIEKMRV